MAHVTVDGITARIRCLEEWAQYALEETANWLGNANSAENDLQHLSNLEIRSNLSKRLLDSRKLITNLESRALKQVLLKQNVERSLVKMEPEEEESLEVFSSPPPLNHAPMVECQTQTDVPVKVVPKLVSKETQTEQKWPKGFIGHWVTTPTTSTLDNPTPSVSNHISTVTSNGISSLKTNLIKPSSSHYQSISSVALANSNPGLTKSSSMQFARQTHSVPRNKYPRLSGRLKNSVRCPECSRQVGNNWNLEMHMRSRHPQRFVGSTSTGRQIEMTSAVVRSTPSTPMPPPSASISEPVDQSRETGSGMRLRDKGKVGTRTPRYDPSIYTDDDSPRVKNPLSCPYCPKMLSHTWNLTKHVNSKHPQNQALVLQNGHSTSTEKAEMSELSETENPPEPDASQPDGNISCLQCGKHFPNGDREALDRHIASRHWRGKRHECDQCPMRFVTRSELECHYRKHTGEKPFECEHCGRRFTHRSTLQKHVFGQHERMKRFKCQHCDRRFNLASRLEAHLFKAHSTSKMPFICRWCDMSFRQRSTLSRHENARHAGQELPTPAQPSD